MAPRVEDVLRSVIWTYDTWLVPNIDGAYERSLAVTTGLMLRHLHARIEQEGPALWEDNADLRTTLGSVRDAVPTVVAEIDDVLKRTFRLPGSYPTVASLVDEAEALRVVLSHVIDALWVAEAPAEHGLVREYLSRQLMRESSWMADVFVGESRR